MYVPIEGGTVTQYELRLYEMQLLPFVKKVIVEERRARGSLTSSRSATIFFLMRPADTLTKQ